MKRTLAMFFALIFVMSFLFSCDRINNNETAETDQKQEETSQNSEVTSETVADHKFFEGCEDMFTDNDKITDYDEATAVKIVFDNDKAHYSSDTVKEEDGRVILTGNTTYILSGNYVGCVIVDTDEAAKPRLILDGLTVTNPDFSALYVKSCEKLFVTLTKDSKNVLTTEGEFVPIDENNADGCVFSKEDITFNGEGSIEINSKSGHGIVCKDDFVIYGGTYVINSASHGVDANDSIRLSGADVTVDSGKDGLHAENSDDAEKGFFYADGGNYTIDAEGDGISAGYYLRIDGGSFNIVTGGGSVNGEKQTSDNFGGFRGEFGGGQMPPGRRGNTQVETAFASTDSTSIKGIKAQSSILITNGEFTLDTADDSIHSNASITVGGGTFTLNSGDDGFHADETLTVNSGNVTVVKSYEGLEGLNIELSGGNLNVVSSDDGINAAGGVDQSGYGGARLDEGFGGMMGGHGGTSTNSNGSIVINGGNVYIQASGDGIDANGTLEINGGHTVVCGPTQGDTAVLDYDKSAVINGGTFIGTGSTMMAQTFSGSTQGVISLSVGSQSAETKIEVTDENGKVLATHFPKLPYGIMIVSTPKMITGETYTVSVGEYTGEFTAD